MLFCRSPRISTVLGLVLLTISGCAHQSPRPQTLETQDVATVETDAFSAELFPTEVPQGGIATVKIKASGTSTQKIQVAWEGGEARVFQDSESAPWTHLALLPIPNHFRPSQLKIKVTVSGESGEEIRFLDLAVKERTAEYERVRVKKKHLRRMGRTLAGGRRNGKLAPNADSGVTEERLWDGPWRLPVEGAVTSEFGTNRTYNSRVKRPHLGVDMKARTGDPIVAPAGGRVTLARRLFQMGYTVIIDHGFGIFTNYGHLSKILVKPNQVVDPGTLIGLAGRTGRATGPHLHWGATVQGVTIDPLELVRALN